MNGCNGCTLCCQLVPVVELGVRAFARCPHELSAPFSAVPGCGIYSDRPHSCRVWHCQFLLEGWNEELRPSRCGVVVDPAPDLIRVFMPGTPERDRKERPAVQMWAAPGFEDAYKRQPVLSVVLASIDAIGAVVWRIRAPGGGQLAIGLWRDPKGVLHVSAPAPADVDYMRGRSEAERLHRAAERVAQLHGQQP